MLLVLIAMVAVAIEGVRTARHISRCKVLAQEYEAAEQRCYDLARSIQEQADKNRAIDEEYLQNNKAIDEATEEAILQSLATALLQGDEPEAILRKKTQDTMARLMQKRLVWQDQWEEESAQSDAESRDLARRRLKALEWARYNARMKRKYRRAASHFWEPLTPDEPEPSRE